MLTVEEMMTVNPYTLHAINTLNDAKQIMKNKGIRHIPIISKKGELEGLVTQRDLLSAQDSSLEKNLSHDTKMKKNLTSFLSKSLFTLTPNAELKKAALYMQKHKIGCLPIVEHKKLVGIITDSDFVSIAINLIELQEEVEPIEWAD